MSRMMKWALALVFSVVASVATATVDAWPALYDVQGVASDDVLNIRSTPSASSSIVATIPHNMSNVEVIRMDDSERWGLVNAGERSGWVSLSYLERHPGQWVGSTPQITQCYGTEPFWGLNVANQTMSLSIMGESDSQYFDVWRTQSSNRVDRFGIGADGIVGFISGSACNDGMSNREFGLSIELMTERSGRMTQLSGCCSIAP